MKRFKDFIIEEDDDTNLETKNALISFITSNLYRYINSDATDNKPLLMLIAALSILNTSNNTAALNTARRLATGAMQKASRKAP
jgi:hypothetical protein